MELKPPKIKVRTRRRRDVIKGKETCINKEIKIEKQRVIGQKIPNPTLVEAIRAVS